MRIKINMLEATAAKKPPLTAAEKKAKIKLLVTALKEAKAKLTLATTLFRLKQELNRTHTSQTQKNRVKAQIKAHMEKAGIVRTPNYPAALNEVEKIKKQLEKARTTKKD